jgi:hypothetical protein
VDTSDDPQCYVFRACYPNYIPNGALLSEAHYSNEIAVSPQRDGSLYWTYVSCYQVQHPVVFLHHASLSLSLSLSLLRSVL